MNDTRRKTTPDYHAERQDFRWERVREALIGDGNDQCNMATLAVDRHVLAGHSAGLALRCLSRDGHCRDFSYGDLQAQVDRFAGLLAALGIIPGERVYTLLGRVPEVAITALGSLKFGAVYCPLFAAFGPEPVSTRLRLGQGRVLVTTRQLYERKVAPFRDSLPALEHLLLLDDDQPGASFQARLQAVKPLTTAAATRANTPALLHFTSGTTGAPKGAVHGHGAVLAHFESARRMLDLHPGDRYWCTADPGWVTGISYGLIAPLIHGVVNLLDEGEFDAGRWYRILAEQRIQVWYTAPTAIRLLMRAGDDLPQRFDLSALRLMASVGEPLNPEAIRWAERVLGRPFLDTWWQTETGTIMIANLPDQSPQPGTMGRPLPGIDAAIVQRRRDGHLDFLAAGQEGELALKANWPSLFQGYLDQPERYAACFADGYYLSGDLARRDADGYYWFVGRQDDVIKSAGHLIGPFEVESALLEHPAVAEVGVIGKPDAVVGNLIKAFVALKPDYPASPALRRELLGFARQRLGPAVAPREIELVASLPRTRSGKILRRLLRNRELGLADGDISTLEQDDD